MWDTILDLTISRSFDASGFMRHQKHYKKISDEYIKHRTVLITGGTSGIGKSLAQSLNKLGATVFVTGRDPEKFQTSGLKEQGIHFISLDLCDHDSIEQIVSAMPSLDYIVCNAGAMPGDLTIVKDKYDAIFGSQVIGHLILIKQIIKQNKANEECAFHFNSSGGLLLKKLDLSDLTWKKNQYNKISSYANAKRAQSILSEYLSMRFSQFTFSTSHPGWVDTPALCESMPKFYEKFKNRLRTADQGADTLLWLVSKGQLIHSGKFWFDRKKRNLYPFFWTRESEKTRNAFIELIKDYLDY